MNKGMETVTRKIGTLKIGIDVGGTFTDFLLVRDDAEPAIFKTPSTPQDPSIGLINGLTDIAASLGQTLEELAPTIATIVHGTTVTTNATLTRTGAKTGLLTTEGVRDALEMRRGIREEQYNNRYTNVPPLVPRYLRRPARGRLDRTGRETAALETADVEGRHRDFPGGGGRCGGHLLHEQLRQPCARAGCGGTGRQGDA